MRFLHIRKSFYSIIKTVIILSFIGLTACGGGGAGGGGSSDSESVIDPKSITIFNFSSPAATGVITESNHTIAITVPYGTVVTALVPTITHSGVSISPLPGVAKDFTTPVTYTVTADDGTTQSYTVTVIIASNNAKAITGFSFSSPAATGVITESNHTIAITVPYGTVVTALVPAITHTGASINPLSGVAKDFTNPVSYTVTAVNSETQIYTVTVTIAPELATVTTSEIIGNDALSIKINGTSAWVRGTVVSAGAASITVRGLCWSTNPNPTKSDSHVNVSGTIGEFTQIASGLTEDTVYYVRAYATTSAGTAYGNQIYFNSGKTLGTSYQDGLVFWNDGEGSGLVAATSDQSTGTVWSNITSTLIGDTETALGTGQVNTAKILAQGATSGAAYICNNYSSTNYSDWFLPSKNELNQMSQVLSLSATNYWSSSEESAGNAYGTYNNTGTMYVISKGNSNLHVRPVRKF